MKREYTSPDIDLFALRLSDILIHSAVEATIAVDNTEATSPPPDDDPWLPGSG